MRKRYRTLAAAPEPKPEPRIFRVVHRQGWAVEGLGELENITPHPFALDAYVSFLLHKGAEGEVLLIDAATGEVLIRRPVQPPDRRP